MFIFSLLRIGILYIFSHFKLLLAVFGELPGFPIMVIMAVVSIYTVGHIKGTGACEARQLKEDLKKVEKHGKIEQKVGGLGDSDLDKRLRKYFRD